jgi:hypothetical protein
MREYEILHDELIRRLDQIIKILSRPVISPEPLKFQRGDKVLAWDDDEDPRRVYFAEYTENSTHPYHVFLYGDEWSSEGETWGYQHCMKWKE